MNNESDERWSESEGVRVRLMEARVCDRVRERMRVREEAAIRTRVEERWESSREMME
jgi:hypothetical protein